MHYSSKYLVALVLALGLLIPPFLANAQEAMDNFQFVTQALPDATVGQPYDFTFQATGGTAPYVYPAVGNDVSAPFALDDTGHLTGVPTEAGQRIFHVTVRDSSLLPQNVEQDFTLTVNPAQAPVPQLTVNGPNRTDGVVGEMMLPIGVNVTGGTADYTWTVSGTLPSGVTFDPINPDGTLMALGGTPTEAGQFTFTLTVSDSGQPQLTFSKDVTFTVAAAPGEVPPAEPPADQGGDHPAGEEPPLVPQAQPFQFNATIFSGLVGTWNCTIDINGALTEVLPSSTCQNTELVGQDALLGANGDILFDQGAITIESAANGIYNLKGFARLRGPLAAADDEALKIYFDQSDNPVSLRPAADQPNQNNALLEGIVSSGYFGDAMLTSGVQLLAVCGDFQIGVGEQCDDGNQNNFDLCSNMCRSQGVLPPGINSLPYTVRLEQFYNVITAFAAFPFIALEGEAGFMTQGLAVTGNYEGTLTTNEGNIIPTVWNVLPEDTLRVPEGRNKFEFMQEMVDKVKNNELTFTGEEMVDVLYVIHTVNLLNP